MMKAGWKLSNIGAIGRLATGTTPPSKKTEYYGGDLQWYTPQDIDDSLLLYKSSRTLTALALTDKKARLFPSKTILLTAIGNIGRVGILAKESSANQQITGISLTTDKFDIEYVFYWLLGNRSEILRRASHAVIPIINQDKIKQIPISYPPIDEQRRIVARIKECMERVEEIERLHIESNKVAGYLPFAVFADYVESLDRTNLGDNVLGDVVTECKYGTSIKANSTKKGYPVLRMGNIQGGMLDVSDLKHIDLTRTEAQKYLLQEGDVLVNRTNSLELVGKSAVFSKRPGDWIYASYLIRLRFDQSHVLPEYVNAVINSRIGREYVLRTARRAIGMVNINAQEIRRMPLPLPSISQQQNLIDKMREVAPLVDDLTEHLKNRENESLRESILRKAFAGEL